MTAHSRKPARNANGMWLNMKLATSPLRSMIEGTALELSSADTEFGSPNQRRLRAMVHADVAGYSRLIGMNDAATVRRLRTLRRALIDPAIRTFHGAHREHRGRLDDDHVR